MPKDAVKCNVCDSYRNWRRFTAVSSAILPLLIALIAVFPPALTALSNFIDRRSHTNFNFAGATDDAVNLTVWNTGQRPSALSGGRLNFNGRPIDDVELDLRDGDVQAPTNIVSKDARMTVVLTVLPFQGCTTADNPTQKRKSSGFLRNRP
jgi:hypothetical protein